MREYQLLIDTWEGQLDVDENVLKANGVAGMLIRLNDINGGHHKDEYFDIQWTQARAAGFVCAPYFVYNPWVSGAQNFAWLNEHMPADAKAMIVDIEVRKSDVSRATYAAEVSSFKALAKKRWRSIVYTGEWFLSYLSYWPTDLDFWWAQYPYQFYPSDARQMSWDQLRAELEAFTGPSNGARCPGPLRMWQISGDRLILPGSRKPIDVNVFFGSYADLEDWLGKAVDVPPAEPPPVVTPPDPTTEPQVYFAEVVSGPITVRKYPQVIDDSKTAMRLQVGEILQGRIWAGNGYVWMQIEVSARVELIGFWCAVRKLDGSGKLMKLTELPLTPEPVSQSVRTTLGFFDKPMVDYYHLDIENPDTWHGDFDHVNLMMKFADSNQTQANAIAQWWVLSAADMDWLWHIQPRDDDIYVNATLQNKKNWHLNATGTDYVRPIWKSGNEYRYGLMVYGHQPVRIKNGVTTFRANFPSGKTEFADFVKVDGLTRAMMKPMGEFVDHVIQFQGKNYATRIRSGVLPLLEQGYIQVCTEPNRARKISITNKGIKLMFNPAPLPYPIPNPWNLPQPRSDYFVVRPVGEYYLWKGALA